jgi:hypothetical protein
MLADDVGERRRLYDQYGLFPFGLAYDVGAAALDPDFEDPMNRALPPQGYGQFTLPQQSPYSLQHQNGYIPQRQVPPRPVPKPVSRPSYYRSPSSNSAYAQHPVQYASTPDPSNPYYHPQQAQAQPPPPPQHYTPITPAGQSPHVSFAPPTQNYFPNHTQPSLPLGQQTRYYSPPPPFTPVATPMSTPMSTPRPSPQMYYRSPPGTPVMTFSPLPPSADYSPRVVGAGDYFSGVHPVRPTPSSRTSHYAPHATRPMQRSWLGTF